MRIQACLNGSRTPAEHPAVPVTPAQLAAAAAEAVAAGAEAVHLHPRGSDGRESLRAADVGAAVAAVRGACPPTPVGVTTALWVTGDAALRQEQVAAWTRLPVRQRPDFASVNVSEEGWRAVTALLASAGIGAEAGVWSAADAHAATRPPDAGRPPGAVRAAGDAPPRAGGPGSAGGWLRILVEISGVTAAEAVPRASEILAELGAGGVTAPVLLHGEGDSCWPLVAHAGRLGLATRIGLEDVLTGPGGQEVAGNAGLVRLALAEWSAGHAR